MTANSHLGIGRLAVRGIASAGSEDGLLAAPRFFSEFIPSAPVLPVNCSRALAKADKLPMIRLRRSGQFRNLVSAFRRPPASRDCWRPGRLSFVRGKASDTPA